MPTPGEKRTAVGWAEERSPTMRHPRHLEMLGFVPHPNLRATGFHNLSGVGMPGGRLASGLGAERRASARAPTQKRRSAEAQEPEAGEVGLEAAPARSHNGGRDAGLIVLNVARIYYMIS